MAVFSIYLAFYMIISRSTHFPEDDVISFSTFIHQLTDTRADSVH